MAERKLQTDPAALSKLRLPPSESDHRRVLAVVTYLRGDGAQEG